MLFVDRLDPNLCLDGMGRPCPPEESVNVRYLLGLMEQFGLGDDFSLLLGDDRPPIGMPRTELLERTRHAAFLLNVMGFLDDAEILGASHKRVFLDIDPGFGQMWRALGLADPFRGHDLYVTIGENIGKPDCTIPTVACIGSRRASRSSSRTGGASARAVRASRASRAGAARMVH